MSMTDPIADMLTRIRNANKALHDSVEIPSSKIKYAIARILREEGFIKHFKYIRNKKQGVLKIFLKYGPDRERVIKGIQRISKPGRRQYSAVALIPKVKGGLGITILTTSKGIMTGRKARTENIGGEVICSVW
ncbi:MAG: 30S ribosomal protein S8 [Candidatus Sumerlaeota bacterium]|nr:30S ribosomal protein S8 [Candidatus Sumerlaeota bacterium]